jgi:hypothetical protein
VAVERDWLRLEQQDADRDWIILDAQPCTRCLELEAELERLRAELWVLCERCNRSRTRMFWEIFRLECELVRCMPHPKARLHGTPESIKRTKRRRRQHGVDALTVWLRNVVVVEGRKFEHKLLREILARKIEGGHKLMP